MNGLLICSGEGKTKNIGDYIQSVAQEQFFDNIDCFVEREHLDTYVSSERTNLIMNGWFMWHPENFPPSENINPLFISFHIVPSIASKMMSSQTIRYLKKYEPIGARDYGTKKLLDSYGICSYFSGCLTLTLGLKYKSPIKNNDIIFVDPYYEIANNRDYRGIKKYYHAFRLVYKHLHKVWILQKKFVPEFPTIFSKYCPLLNRLIGAASFYEAYNTIFEDDVLMNASYVTHEVMQKDFKDDSAKLKYAKELINKYAKAKLVITSRIHCALPSLGVDTPTIFVTSEALQGNSLRSSGRFGGLIELFHTIKWTQKGVEIESESLKRRLLGMRISRDTIIENASNAEPLKKALISKVNEFLKNTNNGK